MEHETHTEHHGEHTHANHGLPVHKSRPPKKTIIIGLAGLLLILLVFNQIQIFGIYNTINDKTAAEKDAAKPASLQLMAINDNSCSDCFSTKSIIAGIKGDNVNITQEKNLNYSSEEAKTLIESYGITKVPAVIITGEISKVTLQGFEKQNDGLVLQQISPPYRDLNTQSIIGRISLTILNVSSCPKCPDMTIVVSQMKQAGISIFSEKNVDIKTAEGSELVKKYNITKAPTILLSNDAGQYSVISTAWQTIGTVENDGTFVMRETSPPYYDVASKEIRGLASVILLNDSTCKECYNVTDHLSILKLGFGIDPETTKTADISSSEGKTLIKKYNITAVPTIIIYNVDAYESLKPSWAVVGSIEKDGAYIFRNFDQWQGNAYKDLTTGKVVPNTASE